MKYIVIICLKSGADPPLRFPRIAWLEGIVTSGRQQRNGLGRHQAIVWTNDEILLIWPLGTNFWEMLVQMHIFSFTTMYVNMSSARIRPFCLSAILKLLALFMYVKPLFEAFKVSELHIAGPVCGETSGPRYIPFTKASNAESVSMSWCIDTKPKCPLWLYLEVWTLAGLTAFNKRWAQLQLNLL